MGGVQSRRAGGFSVAACRSSIGSGHRWGGLAGTGRRAGLCLNPRALERSLYGKCDRPFPRLLTGGEFGRGLVPGRPDSTLGAVSRGSAARTSQ